MSSRIGRQVSSVLRVVLWRLAALVGVGCIGVALWLLALGQAPPLPPGQADDGQSPKTESGVTWVPGIGNKVFGNCTRILSIDGGGVRGLVPALILAEIERRTGRPLFQQFDLIVGASTGAILALGLTRPSNSDARRAAFSAPDLVRLYREQSTRIFPRSFALLRSLRRVFRPKFSPDDVEDIYATYFEDVRLIEALTNVAVPAYDIEENRRLWFRSISSGHGDMLMRDLVRGATAAPTFLPPARFAVARSVSAKGHVALVDGALFANNPSLDALLFGRQLRQQGDQSVLLISLGTGRLARKNSFEAAWGWGVLGWMNPLLDIAFSDPGIDDLVSRDLEGRGTYFRLQLDLGTIPVELDDSSPEAAQRLDASTALFIEQQEDQISSIVSELSLPRAPDCDLPLGADYERPVGPRARENSVDAD
jgi:predicted acylesterase/phospholipase RssA